MKKLYMLILLSALLLLVSCNAEMVQVDDDVEFVLFESGKKYTTISQNFDIVVNPVKIFKDEMNDKIIEYSFGVYNKTEKTFNNLKTNVRLNPSVEKYMQGNSFNALTTSRGFKLVPKSKAETQEKGQWALLPGHRSSILFNDGDKTELVEAAKEMELQIDWRGGSECFMFTLDVDDALE